MRIYKMGLIKCQMVWVVVEIGVEAIRKEVNM